MTADETAKIRADVSTAMLETAEMMAPVFDSADGVRADLERRGWSPTVAEQVAGAWLVGAIGHVWRPKA